ncbi:MAG TPA: SCO family protein [bacterium]|nr:SCO family protein [bacterium]
MRFLKVILLLSLAAATAACARPLPVFGDVPDFVLTDQTGRTVTNKDLAGSVWVADFIYTGCATACPALTQRMAELKRLARLVTFTVDPEVDTPERLKAYSERFGAEPASWSFLTGPVEEVRKTISEGFKLSAQKVDADVFHSEKLVLVDARGRIRGYFDADPEGLEALRRAVRRCRESSKESS